VPVLLQGSGQLRNTPAAAVTFNMTVRKVNGCGSTISLCEPLLQADLHLKLICKRYLRSSFVCTPLSTTCLASGHSIVRLDIMYAGALLCSGLWNVRSSSSLVRSASCAEQIHRPCPDLLLAYNKPLNHSRDCEEACLSAA
jgi:hypothetical protein